jgi:type II secretory pathway component PulM
MSRMPSLANFKLQPRQQWLIVMATPVVLILIVLLATKYLISERKQAEDALEHTLEDIAWLQGQSRFISRQGLRCPAPAWQADAVAALARRYTIILKGTPRLGDGRLELDVDNADGNRLLEFTRLLECQGAMVQNMEISTIDSPGMVRGRIVALLP